MTKTSHSKIYSTESGITGGGFFKTHPLHFTKEQLEWIENIQLPKRLFLISATEFDDRYLYLHDDWRYRFSGNNLAILFSTGKYFCDLSPVSLKLLKYLTIAYINENSASVADKFAQFVATTFKQIEVITRESLIEKMQMLVAKTERNHSDSSQFYYTLYALRKLDRNGFFESKDDSDELEDLLLEVPRPRNNNWARYQNLDLVIPEEVCLMIENGIQRWASKLCPKIDVEENKNIHLETVRKTIKIDTLRDCIIIGIVYYIGARPVQIGKLSGGDFIVDTENKYGMRYSVLVPYAKKSKLTIDRVRVAIPEELGKLILLYKYLVGIGDTDPMFSIIVSSMKMVEASLKKMLFRFSPQEIQEAVKNDDYQLTVYTASLFRHNVGHSMAMSGASAPEIAYILGQSSYVVADRYIAATPELADIREAALGRNPVFKNMMALMLTGNLVHSSEWEGRNVAGSIGGQLHYHLGGCNYEEDICPFAQGRGCYGCLYFKPFIDGNHKKVFLSLNDEIQNVRDVADDAGILNHPLLKELVRRKEHVNQVMARIEMAKAGGLFNR
ncbi:TPA: site-specific integrase [Escherichia coli]|nr:site-specific integrase [Escherichia coli]